MIEKTQKYKYVGNPHDAEEKSQRWIEFENKEIKPIEERIKSRNLDREELDNLKKKLNKLEIKYMTDVGELEDIFQAVIKISDNVTLDNLAVLTGRIKFAIEAKEQRSIGGIVSSVPALLPDFGRLLGYKEDIPKYKIEDIIEDIIEEEEEEEEEKNQSRYIEFKSQEAPRLTYEPIESPKIEEVQEEEVPKKLPQEEKIPKKPPQEEEVPKKLPQEEKIPKKPTREDKIPKVPIRKTRKQKSKVIGKLITTNRLILAILIGGILSGILIPIIRSAKKEKLQHLEIIKKMKKKIHKIEKSSE